MKLRFRDNPGCRERHLRRKLDNPLFPPGQRAPTQSDLERARHRDDAELARFTAEVQQLVEQIACLRPDVDPRVLTALKHKAYRFYEQCTGLPGDQEQVKQALTRLIDTLTEALQGTVGRDAAALAQLDREREARENHFALLEYDLTGDLLRQHSPIASAEVVPTLLCQTQDDLRVILRMFKEARLKTIVEHGRRLLSQRQAEGHELREAARKLDWIEQHLQELRAEEGTA